MVSMEKLAYVGFWFEGLKCEADVQRVASLLRNIGYRGVDFKDLCFDTSIYPLHKMLEIAVKAAEKEDMTIPCGIILKDHCAPNWKENAEKTCEFIRMCAAAGIKLVNTSIGSEPPRIEKEWYFPPVRNDKPGWDALKGSLEMLAKTAEECDVHVVLETVMGQLAHDYYTAREMFRQMDSDRLCLTMDPSHYQLYDNDVPWTIRQWGTEKIRHVHLKDAVGSMHSGHSTPLMGEGHVDWPGFFAALEEIGYNGWYSVEFESWPLSELITPEEAARMSYRCTEAVIQNYLKNK